MKTVDNQQIKERIRELLRQHGDSVNSLSKELRVSQKTLNNQINGTCALSLDTIVNIATHYRTSADRLLALWADPVQEITHPDVINLPTPDTPSKKEEGAIPLFRMRPGLSLRSFLNNKEPYAVDSIKIPRSPKCDGALYVINDSMYPLIKPGDIVAFSEIKDLSYIISGEIYLVGVNMGGEFYTLCKYVKTIPGEPDKVTLLNFAEGGDSLIIDKSCIEAIAIVKASINFRGIG
ncbi:S24 family peptidase [Bacteroides sedimenti]|uniref:HTH cro/C1-type domain-containing protein n=1 Tax=Bacteroides sedimenti TaxID=2136147 RepID=A0ABM8IEG0_9BACE